MASIDITMTTTEAGELPLSQQEVFTFDDNNLHNEFTRRLLNMQKQNFITDITLKAGVAVVKCHKVALAAASQYFHDLILYEQVSDTVNLHNMSPGCLEAVIAYIYTSRLQIDAEYIKELAASCDRLQLNSLKTAVDGYIAQKISPTNCLGMFMFAKEQNLPVTHDAVKVILFTKAEEVRVSASDPEFKVLGEAALIEWISDDKLDVPKEDSVFFIVERWVQADRTARETEACVSKVLKHVRLPLCEPMFLVRNVARSLMVRFPACQELLNEAKEYGYLLMAQEDTSIMDSERTRPRKPDPVPETVTEAIGEGENLVGAEGEAPLIAPKQEAATGSITETQAVREKQEGAQGAEGGNKELDEIKEDVEHEEGADVVVKDPVKEKLMAVAAEDTASDSDGMTGLTDMFANVEVKEAASDEAKPKKFTKKKDHLKGLAKGGEDTASDSGEDHPDNAKAKKPTRKREKESTEGAVGGQKQADEKKAEKHMKAKERVPSKILILGGYGDGNVASAQCWELPEGANQWTDIPQLSEKQVPFVEGMRACVVGTDIIVTGGNTNVLPTRATSNTWKYSTSRKQWSALPAMREARAAHGMASNGHMTFVAGGVSGENLLSSVEKLDGSQNKWSACAPLPHATNHSHATFVNGALFVISGHGYKTQRYDLKKNTWSVKADMPRGCDFAGVTSLSKTIYVLGYNKCVAYHTTNDSWSTITKPQRKRFFATALAFQGKVLLLGGSLGGNAQTLTVEQYDPNSKKWGPGAVNMPKGLVYHCAIAV